MLWQLSVGFQTASLFCVILEDDICFVILEQRDEPTRRLGCEDLLRQIHSEAETSEEAGDSSFYLLPKKSQICLISTFPYKDWDSTVRFFNFKSYYWDY